jgi:carboxymethylenebutenolidase
MMEMQRYLAEEVAEDLADGIITRREAIRRLGLLGVTGAAAAGLLTTFVTGEAAASTGSEVPAGHDSRRGALETTWAPVARESITFAGPRVPLMAAWAAAAKPRGGVLVIHENRGLTEHIRTVAGRLAASGYSALALDLLSEEGGTGAFPGEAEVAAALAQIPPERFIADMKASVTELKRRVRGKRLTAIGFCFGGGMVRACSPPANRALPRPLPSTDRSRRAATSRALARRCSVSTADSTPVSTQPDPRPRRRSRRPG